MPLRVVAAGVSYVLYLLLDERGSTLWAGVTGAGVLLLGWTLIDRFTIRRAERLGLPESGAAVVGLAAIATGLALV